MSGTSPSITSPGCVWIGGWVDWLNGKKKGDGDARTGGSVNRQQVALAEHSAGAKEGERFLLGVHLDLGAAGDAGLPHAAGHDSSVAV